jgi:hypothetical protein
MQLNITAVVNPINFLHIKFHNYDALPCLDLSDYHTNSAIVHTYPLLQLLQ